MLQKERVVEKLTKRTGDSELPDNENIDLQNHHRRINNEVQVLSKLDFLYLFQLYRRNSKTHIEVMNVKSEIDNIIKKAL